MTRKTIWEAIKDEGREEGMKMGMKEATVGTLRKTLMHQLRTRFGQVPRETSAVIEATDTVRQLDKWLERFATAETLEDMRIDPLR